MYIGRKMLSFWHITNIEQLWLTLHSLSWSSEAAVSTSIWRWWWQQLTVWESKRRLALLTPSRVVWQKWKNDCWLMVLLMWHGEYRCLLETSNVCLGGRHSNVWIVNARHIKNVLGHKTDKMDSEWICKLLLAGLLKPSYIPPKEQRQLRDLTRYRNKLIQTSRKESHDASLGRLQYQTFKCCR